MYRLEKGTFPATVNPNGRYLNLKQRLTLPNGIYVTNQVHGRCVYQHGRRIEVEDGRCWLLNGNKHSNNCFNVIDFFEYNVIYATKNPDRVYWGEFHLCL